ncbi:hypothetical protein CRUP_008289 [Coryphaenoides rupestris]|nr:hypothetical protein CRUP_008289 [Coryphaenoides rupestris]
MEFLIGNLFSTQIGTRIEHATNSSLQTEDWALNMEICDLVNSSDEGPRDAVKAIRKRIVGNKNFKEVMYTLTVLEACVKNCGHRFHVLVSTREFVEGVLVRSIIPKNNPPLAWADAFRSSPDLTGVVSVYEDLRRKGLDFPAVQLDSYSTRNPNASKSLPVNGALSIPPHPKPSPNPPESKEENNVFNPDKVRKLKADMATVQSDLTVMADMMSQMDPVTAKQADVEMLQQQLYLGCKAMQERIVELLPRLSDEALIEELLAANDEMNCTGESDSDAYFPQTNASERPSEAGAAAVEGVASGHAHCVQAHGMIPLNQSAMMDDIEKWLDYDDEVKFDRFLAGRAQAAERLPSLRPSPVDPSPPPLPCSTDPSPPHQGPPL